MLIISLDEYGRFENPHSGRCMIAGVIYEDKTGNGRQAELNRIRDFLEEACDDCGCHYPQDLHFQRDPAGNILNLNACNQVKSHIANIFGDFLKKAKGTYYLYAVVSERSGISMFNDADAGNLLRDDYAGNKYLHMTQMAVRNLLVNNPVLQDSKYHLEFATRVLTTNGDTTLQSQSQELGLSSPRDATGSRIAGVYNLTDTNSYISTLSAAMLESKRRDADFTLRVQSINYSTAGESSRLQGFLYLADIVCSLLETVIPGDGHTAQRVLDQANSFTDHKKNMVWCYDDVDEQLRSAQQNRLAGRWLDSLNVLYDIQSAATPQAEFYRQHWVPVQMRHFQQDATPLLMEHAARELAAYVKQPDAGTTRGSYLATQLLEILKKQNDPQFRSCRYWLYSALVTLSNHRGKSDDAKAYYQQAMTYAGAAPLEDYLELRNAYSVFLLDQKSYTESLENTEQTLIYEELAEDLRKEASDSRNTASPHYGMTLSQLGQCYAFLEDHPQAQAYFLQALEKFGGDEINTQITRSYLLHSYIENGDREEYLSLCRDYFGCDTLQHQLERIGSMSHTSAKFALFLLVKGWHRFRIDEASVGVTQQLLRRILGMQADRSEHPWELICKYCALIAREKRVNGVVEPAIKGIETVAAQGHSGILSDICEDALGAVDGRDPLHPDLTYMYR